MSICNAIRPSIPTLRMLARLVVPALAWSTGCAEVDESEVAAEGEPDEDHDKVYSGVVDTGHKSVGRISQGGTGVCTGTLIQPNVVLTAAHCLDTSGVTIYNFTTDDGKVYPGARVLHPSYAGTPTSASAARYDMALLFLETSVPSTFTTPSGLVGTSPNVGADITLVGFGISPTAGYGTKRKTENKVDSVQTGHFGFAGVSGGTTDGGACSGDSGGPIFVKQDNIELVAGVVSSGTGTGCGAANTTFSPRLDPELTWLNNTANACSAGYELIRFGRRLKCQPTWNLVQATVDCSSAKRSVLIRPFTVCKFFGKTI